MCENEQMPELKSEPWKRELRSHILNSLASGCFRGFSKKNA